MITENIYISTFNVLENGTIEVRKTTDVIKNEEVIATSYWRTVLQVDDSTADEVLGTGTYYRNLAQNAWDTLPS